VTCSCMLSKGFAGVIARGFGIRRHAEAKFCLHVGSAKWSFRSQVSQNQRDLGHPSFIEQSPNGVPHFSPILREVGKGRAGKREIGDREVGISELRIPNPVWQPRCYDFNVGTEKKRIEKLRYIHRNPVKRGLVTSPEQWGWSSFVLLLQRTRPGQH
jgi:hypothetical protein